MFVDDRWVKASADERHDSMLVLHCVSHVVIALRQYTINHRKFTHRYYFTKLTIAN